MKAIACFLPFLILLFSLNNPAYAQSREQFESAASAADAMSKALTKLDEVNKASDVVKEVSKFAKAAKAFGAASTILNIGISLFGGDEQNIIMLKQITKMVAEVNTKLDKLEVQVKTGFENLENANEYRNAQSQVFKSISHIRSCMVKVEYYLNTTDQVAMDEAAADVLKIDLDELGTDIQNILRSCRGANGTLSSNLLDASINQSHANMAFIEGICMQLLSAVSMAAYVENIYSQLSNSSDPARQDAARKRVSSEYGKYIDQMELAITQTLTRCANFNTISRHARKGVDKSVARHGNESAVGMVTQNIQNDLQKAWPNMEVIVVAYDNYPKVGKYEKWNNYKDHNLQIVELEWESPKYFGVAWIIPHSSIISASRMWNSYISDHFILDWGGLGSAVETYYDYYLDENLHRYVSDGKRDNKARPFGPNPFCFVSRLPKKITEENSFPSTKSGNNMAFYHHQKNHRGINLDASGRKIARQAVTIIVPNRDSKY